MEVFGCETFRLGWEQALLDPLARVFSGPEEYNALNKVESKNYDLYYYVSKENLIVTYAKELKDEIEVQGGGSQASKSVHSNPSVKD